MATHVIDLSSDKNIQNASPISMMAFMFTFVLINMFMDVSLLYFIAVAISFILCQVFFQFTPRMVFLSIKFYLTQTDLSPTLPDTDYYADEYALENLQKVLIKKDEERKQIEEFELKYLNLYKKKLEVKNESRK